MLLISLWWLWICCYIYFNNICIVSCFDIPLFSTTFFIVYFCIIIETPLSVLFNHSKSHFYSFIILMYWMLLFFSCLFLCLFLSFFLFFLPLIHSMYNDVWFCHINTVTWQMLEGQILWFFVLGWCVMCVIEAWWKWHDCITHSLVEEKGVRKKSSGNLSSCLLVTTGAFWWCAKLFQWPQSIAGKRNPMTKKAFQPSSPLKQYVAAVSRLFLIGWNILIHHRAAAA